MTGEPLVLDDAATGGLETRGVATATIAGPARPEDSATPAQIAPPAIATAASAPAVMATPRRTRSSIHSGADRRPSRNSP
jgi:hypothetical protein